MALSAGERLGPYEIVARIGKGGMGEVYKAHDPRTGREVAIKVAAERFSERFDREVRAIAALNHPNICTLFDVGPNYLVMELVEGETLAERIKQGLLPLEAALPIARQITAALEAAHEKGITHRDLKPGNVIVKDDGAVKVLDFGLAKVASAAEVSGGDPELSPTISMHATQAGVILGTAAYMAPEQAKGKPVDKRADIWAFGVVLYEMLTAKRLFQGEDLTDILASVVKEQPDLSAAPPQVRRLLLRCLEKDPNKRLRDISVVWELVEQQPPVVVAGPSRLHLAWLAWAAPVLLISTALFAYLWLRTPAPETLAALFEINPPPGAQLTDLEDTTAVSPDGRYIVFGGEEKGHTSLWLRPLDSLTPRRLQGTENAGWPFWSPDSKSIAFFQEGKLKRIDIAGGAPVVLCDAGGGPGGTWNRDGTILFTMGAIFRVPASGGAPRPVYKRDPARKEYAIGLPQFLPDGKSFLYLSFSGDPKMDGIYAATLDRPEERVRIVATDYNASYVPPRNGQPGYLLWIQERTLMAQPFDAGKRKLEGDPQTIAESVATRDDPFATFWTSDSGVLAYQTNTGAGARNLTWFDRQGKALGTVGKPEGYAELALSPDGSQVAAFRRDAVVGRNLWLIDVARGSSTRLTTDPGNEDFPVWSAAVWSPSGKQVAFSRFTAAGHDLYRKPASVSSAEELLLRDGAENSPLDWLRDGRFLLYMRAQGQTSDLWVLPMDGAEHKAVKYLATQFSEHNGSFSPDGRWVIYVSNVSGRDEVYVSPFPDSASAPAVLVSTEGGGYPRWRRDGKAVYYLSPDLNLMEVDVVPGSTFKAGVPKSLFQTRTRPSDLAGWTWDISPDGQRFLFNTPDDKQSVAPLTVITNWQSKLKK